VNLDKPAASKLITLKKLKRSVKDAMEGISLTFARGNQPMTQRPKRQIGDQMFYMSLV